MYAVAVSAVVAPEVIATGALGVTSIRAMLLSTGAVGAFAPSPLQAAMAIASKAAATGRLNAEREHANTTRPAIGQPVGRWQELAKAPLQTSVGVQWHSVNFSKALSVMVDHTCGGHSITPNVAGRK